MSHEISASWDTLFLQAKDSGEDYYVRARRILSSNDEPFTNADVIALAQVMAYEFRTSSIGVAAQKLTSALNDVATALGNYE